MSAIARIGSNQFNNMQEVAAMLATPGHTGGNLVEVLRNGTPPESFGAFTAPGIFGMKGVSTDGSLPMLTADLYTRPAWGKAILNIEDGEWEVESLHLDGCRVPDSNGAGIRLNPGVKKFTSRNMKVTNNENGLLGAEGDFEVLLENYHFERNGQATNSKRRGYSHQVYFGKHRKVTIRNTSFIDGAFGHEIKSRALELEIENVLVDSRCYDPENAEGNRGRAMDVSNGGIVRVKNSIFRKHADADQNNLIHLRPEGNPDGRPEAYVYENVEFFNDVNPERGVEFIRNDSEVECVLINPLFTGAAASKDLSQTLIGNIRVVYDDSINGGVKGPYNRDIIGAKLTGAPKVATPVTDLPNPPNPIVPAPTADTEWAIVGYEGEEVNVPEKSTVRYGANGMYVTKIASGKFNATNDFFGADPAVGIRKEVALAVVKVAAPVVSAPAPSTPTTPATQAPSLNGLLASMQLDVDLVSDPNVGFQSLTIKRRA